MRVLIARVARTIRRGQLVSSGDRVAMAVSGGSDSVALTWLLHSLEPDTGATVVGLIHVNHLLRGAESDADEQFCRELAQRLSLPIEVARVDVAAMARQRRCSIEVAARRARYDFFAAAAVRLNAGAVATGHTLDDQAETVLLRLLRGAGTRGLSGIRLRRGVFIRPLLDCRRDDLRRYLEARGEAWREDGSNADVRIVRNRLRHELVPLLQDIAPGGVRALARLAALAGDDEAYLMQAAIENRAAVVLADSGHGAGITIDGSALSLLAPAVARRLVRILAAEAAPDVALSARHLEAVCQLAATDKPAGRLDLPGLAVDKQADVLRIGRPAPAVGDSPSDWPDRELLVPGSVVVPETGIEVEASFGVAGPIGALGGPSSAVILAGAVRLPLTVRNRRPGDRFRPFGAPGRRKVQDVLVDRKVPRFERNLVPVVTDADGHIVWVAGVAIAERCRVTSPEDGVLLLKLRKRQ